MDVNGAVTCAVVASAGDNDLDGPRTRSLAALASCGSALAADPRLGGAVAEGHIEGVATYQARVQGAVVRRVFTYRFVAYEVGLDVADAVMAALRVAFTAADLTVLDGTDVQATLTRSEQRAFVVVGGDGDPTSPAGSRAAVVTDQSLGTFD